ncbi:MAG: 16S rRNA (adenine(1518)-N(6)/adenine(1519)-N(6))-dimethyltransferase RsmA [Gemmatimonadota bacterium]|nr:16S rRNA (adenine(1518)-N(6)/adenine(1519)-N(6))-dimethyltransferase RsmA [Gemmatimonadota bacterium]
MSRLEPGKRRAKRALGQNFLVDPNLQRKIVEELGASPGDAVLEVGPGHGELSRHLAGRVARLVLVEKDRDLAAELGDRWAGRDDVTVVEGDALDMDLADLAPAGRALRIVSNVPYNVTSPLLFAFLSLRPPATRIVVMVQREVAERIVSAPGRKTYGALSVGVQAIADADLVFTVGREAFRPRPDVESAVLRIVPDPERVRAIDEAALRHVTRVFFNRRRKQMQKTLRTAPELAFEGDAIAFLRALGLDPRARPETIAPEAFVELSRALA